MTPGLYSFTSPFARKVATPVGVPWPPAWEYGPAANPRMPRTNVTVLLHLLCAAIVRLPLLGVASDDVAPGRPGLASQWIPNRHPPHTRLALPNKRLPGD